MKRFIICTLLFLTAFSTQAAEKYAVLLAGDYKQAYFPYGGSYSRAYWNDLYLTWEALMNKGYKNENIFVLFAEGLDYPAALELENQTYDDRYKSKTYDPNLLSITDISATQRNLNDLSVLLRSKLTTDDFLFVYAFGMGDKTTVSNTKIQLTDGFITDVEFAAVFNPIPAQKKVYWLGQYYSGGFIGELTSSANPNVYVAVSSDWESIMWPCDDRRYITQLEVPSSENEIRDQKKYFHSEYFFHQLCATTGLTPESKNEYFGEPLQNADIDNNSVISVSESAQWTYSHESDNHSNIQISDINLIGQSTSLEYPNLISQIPNVPLPFSMEAVGLGAVVSDISLFNYGNGNRIIGDINFCNNSKYTLMDNKTIHVGLQDSPTIDGGNLLKFLGNSEFIFKPGSKIVVHKNAEPNTLEFYDCTIKNGFIEVEGNNYVSFSGNVILENTEIVLDDNNDLIQIHGNLTLKGTSKITVKSGVKIALNGDFYGQGAQIRLSGSSSFIVNATQNLKSTICVNINGGVHEGIYAENNSTILLNNCMIRDAKNAIQSINAASCTLNNVTVENCTNGISLSNCANYSIFNSHFTAPVSASASSRGIYITYGNGNIKKCTVAGFGTGIYLNYTSPRLEYNTIQNNINYGVFISGSSSLVNFTPVISMYPPSNNIIKNNGITNYGSQILLGKKGKAVLANGYNNIFADNQLAFSLKMVEDPFYNELNKLNAPNNYWGGEITSTNYRKYFSPNTQWVNYSPYSLLPYPLDNNEQLDLAATLLKSGLEAEDSQNYSIAYDAYMSLVTNYPDTKESYYAISRLPYVYCISKWDTEPLKQLLDELIALEAWSDKDFIKDMKARIGLNEKELGAVSSVSQDIINGAEDSEDFLHGNILNIITRSMNENKGSNDNIDVFDEIRKLENSYSEQYSNLLPNESVLLTNYPNPFNPTTIVSFSLPKTSDIELSVFNTKGELLKTLAKGKFNAGIHNLNFDGTSMNSGVFFYKLKTDGKSIVNKMILIK